MHDPERLLNGGATEAELALLRAAAAEEPPPDGARRLAETLGVAGMLPVAGLAHAAQAQAAQLAPAALSTAVRAKLALKWVALASSGLALGGTVLVTSLPRKTPPSPQPRSHAAASAPIERSVVRETEDAGLDAQASTPKPRSLAVADELARLDRARAALAARDARRALAQLAGYADAHPDGMLREEAQLLRIEALTQEKRRARARREAAAFLRAYPTSVHAARMRAWLDGETP